MFIDVRDLIKSYGATKALTGLTFRAEQGRVTGLVGPNGAGKSTALRIILGLISADRGGATIGGRRIHALPQGTVGASLDPAHHPGRSPRAVLRAVAATTGSSADDVERTLVECDLAGVASRRAGALSLGMRQRLGLATALISNPTVLILDEPLNGLDPDGVRMLRNKIRSLAERGGTVLLSSHLLAELERTVDDLVVMNRHAIWCGNRRDMHARGGLEAVYDLLGSREALSRD